MYTVSVVDLGQREACMLTCVSLFSEEVTDITVWILQCVLE